MIALGCSQTVINLLALQPARRTAISQKQTTNNNFDWFIVFFADKIGTDYLLALKFID